MSNKIIIFDLDGTLADIQHRRHFVTDPNYGYSPGSGDTLNNDGSITRKNWKPDWDAFHKACVDDKPNEYVIAIFILLRQYWNKHLLTLADIEIWSGRDESVREETTEWLRSVGIHAQFQDINPLGIKLRMRPHGDHCSDVELKKRWLDEVGKENVLMVFDDRDRLVKMWRDEGLTCLQVAEGKFGVDLRLLNE